jgi:hypothetical protein
VSDEPSKGSHEMPMHTLTRDKPIGMQARYIQTEIQIATKECVIKFVGDILQMTPQHTLKVQYVMTNLQP